MKRPSRRKPGPARLPPVLDLTAAAPLATLLLARRGAPLTVDGSAVERLGGQCLQVLLAAHKTWEADGQDFHLVSPSAALAEAIALFGAKDLADPSVAETSA